MFTPTMSAFHGVLKIHESTDASGELAPILLARDGDALAIVSHGVTRVLPQGALEAVMQRFGAPLEPSERLTTIDTLAFGDGRSLRHVRHLARFDVIARDYVVYETPGGEPLCALATTVAGALEHLARSRAENEP
jgi:hypothetical protein